MRAGEIPDLFSDEDVDKIISGICNEVRGLGIVDSRENCWKFFLARVRLQLKVRNPCFTCILFKTCCWNYDLVLFQDSYDEFEFAVLFLRTRRHSFWKDLCIFTCTYLECTFLKFPVMLSSCDALCWAACVILDWTGCGVCPEELTLLQETGDTADNCSTGPIR